MSESRFLLSLPLSNEIVHTQKKGENHFEIMKLITKAVCLLCVNMSLKSIKYEPKKRKMNFPAKTFPTNMQSFC